MQGIFSNKKPVADTVAYDNCQENMQNVSQTQENSNTTVQDTVIPAVIIQQNDTQITEQATAQDMQQTAKNETQNIPQTSDGSVSQSTIQEANNTNTNIKFCASCGTKCDIDARFCTKCGYKF